MSYNPRKLASSIQQSLSSLQKIIDTHYDDEADFTAHIQTLLNAETDNVDFMSTDFDVHSIPREHVELSIGFFKEWNKDRIQGKRYQEREALNQLKNLVADLEDSLSTSVSRDSKVSNGDAMNIDSLDSKLDRKPRPIDDRDKDYYEKPRPRSPITPVPPPHRSHRDDRDRDRDDYRSAPIDSSFGPQRVDRRPPPPYHPPSSSRPSNGYHPYNGYPPSHNHSSPAFRRSRSPPGAPRYSSGGAGGGYPREGSYPRPRTPPLPHGGYPDDRDRDRGIPPLGPSSYGHRVPMHHPAPIHPPNSYSHPRPRTPPLPSAPASRHPSFNHSSSHHPSQSASAIVRPLSPSQICNRCGLMNIHQGGFMNCKVVGKNTAGRTLTDDTLGKLYTDDGRLICNAWNRFLGDCRTGNCKLEHLCSLCARAGHWATQCPVADPGKSEVRR